MSLTQIIGKVFVPRQHALEKHLNEGEALQRAALKELIEKGEITQEQADNHPQRNLITRAVGVEYSVQVDVAELEVFPGDIILCTSDGLTNFVSPYEMVEILTQTNIFSMPDKLINKALNNQSTDNITAVVLAI